ncbi:Asp-tRNA(Asn)/Glu-tRNA(Gln) amidotransferase subunit GatB [Mycoplasma iguanae]|uniref:Aspartyl/glutamyl-tRNA(Asn/Gln) amidotransferase subunit B n=1 Tax=Mycoplasma iguanae TaxID=292461 RepID=A0ABY5R9E3_9MOLU|nr:Asp-tRNA(Asn)/Glu-tRNA(Gln) amidotransferase subunit GatB [Mycoplasma iguanae]UVD81916.1 Asp-tRNA(Asn)/Glu-tRNA(Gln) amidotransferase subunit GatB [Mycoplasma iguanae]
MNSKYDVVIGIEIHLELNTKTKMFSPAKNSFLDDPNRNVHPIDIGYPGTLPQLNKAAVISAIKLAKALNMKIDNQLHFDRKNYFYPDLPKGFQITQFFRPIGKDGIMPIFVDGVWKEIAVERIHLEEDTAKQLHQEKWTLLDYNRAGIPLIEIVTKPVISSSQEAIAYVNNIRKAALYLGISDAKMEEGSLRVDVNISLKPENSSTLGNKVEIKNMNSISNIKKAIDFEIALQSSMLDNNEIVKQQTKRFDEITLTNVLMREKTGEVDYKYFPEPNIPVIQLEQSLLENVLIPTMPWEREKEFLAIKLNPIHINSLINNIDYLDYFEAINFHNKTKAANLFFSDIISIVNNQAVQLKDLNIKPFHLKEILELIESQKISSKQAKQIIQILQKENKSIQQIIIENKMNQSISEIDLIAILEKIILENENLINSYPQKPDRVTNFLLGNLMKETQGNANPQMANKVVQEILQKKFQ